MITARSIAFRNSRTLPGQAWLRSCSRASSEIPVGGSPHCDTRFLQKSVGEQQDIASALTQRRQRDLEDAQAIVEILAQRPALDRDLGVAVRGGDDPDIGFERLGAAKPLKLTFLKDAEKLRLHRRRHLAHLVEEQETARGLFNLPAARDVRRAAP